MGLPLDGANNKGMGPVGQAALGIGLNVAAEAGNVIFGGIRQKQQLKGQRKALEQQNAAAYDLWQKTNYPAQMEQLRKAGLNPGLLYGMGGAGGQLGGSSAMPDNSGGNLSGMALMQSTMLQAQIENIRANTEKTKTEAAKIGGVDTQKTSTEIMSLMQGIKNQQAQEEGVKLDNLFKQQANPKLLREIDFRIDNLEQNLEAAVRQNEISEATKEQIIVQAKLQTLGMRLDNALKIVEAKYKQQLTQESKDKIIQGYQALDLQKEGLSIQEKIRKADNYFRSLEADFPTIGEVIGRMMNDPIQDLKDRKGVNPHYIPETK